MENGSIISYLIVSTTITGKIFLVKTVAPGNNLTSPVITTSLERHLGFEGFRRLFLVSAFIALKVMIV